MVRYLLINDYKIGSVMAAETRHIIRMVLEVILSREKTISRNLTLIRFSENQIRCLINNKSLSLIFNNGCVNLSMFSVCEGGER